VWLLHIQKGKKRKGDRAIITQILLQTAICMDLFGGIIVPEEILQFYQIPLSGKG